MKLAVATVLIAASMFSASTAGASGGAIGVPPAEVDVGAGVPLGAATVGTSTEILAGIHWASLYWHPTHFDIGIGYVGSFRSVVPGYTLRTTDAGSDANELALNGAYLSLGYAIESHRHWRTWLDARIETMQGSVGETSFPVLGAALRIGTEVYSSGAAAAGGSGAGALVAGTVAIGVYVEAVHRDLPSELGPNGVTAGLSVRIPLLLAAAN